MKSIKMNMKKKTYLPVYLNTISKCKIGVVTPDQCSFPMPCKCICSGFSYQIDRNPVPALDPIRDPDSDSATGTGIRIKSFCIEA